MQSGKPYGFFENFPRFFVMRPKTGQKLPALSGGETARQDVLPLSQEQEDVYSLFYRLPGQLQILHQLQRRFQHIRAGFQLQFQHGDLSGGKRQAEFVLG